MSKGQFIGKAGKTFSVQLYNPATLATIGTALSATEAAPGAYRVDTSLQTGIVYFVATATNTVTRGFWNLDKPSVNGYSEQQETYETANGFKLGDSLNFADSDESYNVTIDRSS